MTRYLLACGLLVLLGLDATASAGEMKTYQTQYYVLHTDLDDNGVKEATVRLTLMAEEFHRRTRGLGGTVNKRLPFVLFANRKDYEAAGGMPGSAGVFTGNRLMAVMNPKYPQAVWSTVQHEGFHQFVHATIGPGIPLWANEGLAEYFGTGIFTGDDFITGLVPPGRLKRVQATLKAERFKSVAEMMRTTPDIWNTVLRTENYDQAWSMVHFLANADNGRYRDAFFGFLRDVAKDYPWERAWVRNFGGDVAAFEARWREYWLKLPDHPTADLYAEAVTATLTSFYARAFSQRQYFKEADEFVRVFEAGKLKMHEDDWLPPSLLEDALEAAPHMGKWRLVHKPGSKRVIMRTKWGTTLEGRFKVRTGRVREVTVRKK